MDIVSAAISHFEYGISHDIFKEPVTSYARAAVDALRAQQQPNAPLTLDELREMGGEPVWIVWPGGRIGSQWWIVGNSDWHMMEFDDRNDYGKTWVAYRRKLEEVQK